MSKEFGAEGLVLAGNRLYKRIIPEKTIDVIVQNGGLENIQMGIVLNSGIEIPIQDILVPLALGEPNNN